MKTSRLTARSRSNLDQRFREIGPVARFSVPTRGWIRAIRNGLGMTSAQLAKRLKIKQPSVIALEQSEARGAIELATLRRVAAALDCALVYALVPNKPLERVVQDRARATLRRQMEPVEHSMLLENQAVSGEDFEARLAELVREINPRRLWDD